MPQKRKFKSPSALKKACERYFNSISRTDSVTEAVETGKTDKYGHAIYKRVPVFNDSGDEIRERTFYIPPRICAMCAYLKITRQTWYRYVGGEYAETDEEREKWTEVGEYANTVCEDWLRSELVRRQKGVTGIISELRANYKHHDLAQLAENSDRRKAQAMQSMDDMLSALREIGVEIDGES